MSVLQTAELNKFAAIVYNSFHPATILHGVESMTTRWLWLAVFLLSPAVSLAQEPTKELAKKEAKAKATAVPYRLTDVNHTLVRVKINGKGPFNFIVDTGCPVLLISEPVGKKLGLDKGWATLDTLTLEGGLELTKVKARIETPFQIEGMNGMGLAGVELHGLMGYTVLAKYKMDFDYTKLKMTWTPLKTEPLPPQPLKGKAATGGLDVMVSIMRILSVIAGIGPAPPPQPRGFFGFELAEKDKQVTVAKVLAKSPAAEAGLKSGDRILEAEGKEIGAVADVLREAAKMTAGRTLRLTIERDKSKQELKITAGDGL
jgi:serine protease DegQ